MSVNHWGLNDSKLTFEKKNQIVLLWLTVACSHVFNLFVEHSKEVSLAGRYLGVHLDGAAARSKLVEDPSLGG